MFNLIHHIAIIGSDYKKSKHFYVDLLGFNVIRENYRRERDDYKIDLACGEQEIELLLLKMHLQESIIRKLLDSGI